MKTNCFETESVSIKMAAIAEQQAVNERTSKITIHLSLFLVATTCLAGIGLLTSGNGWGFGFATLSALVLMQNAIMAQARASVGTSLIQISKAVDQLNAAIMRGTVTPNDESREVLCVVNFIFQLSINRIS